MRRVGKPIAEFISVVWPPEGVIPMPTLIKNIAEQLQQEHQMIGAAAKQLKDLVEGPVSPQEEHSNWLNSVRDSLFSLRSHLKTHFAFEEFGGFMEEVVGASPNSPQVERLKQDHQTILAESERLCRMTGGKSASSETSQLRKQILHLFELLNRHEHAENKLVQRVLMDDLGTTD
jgi:hemerythrin